MKNTKLIAIIIYIVFLAGLSYWCIHSWLNQNSSIESIVGLALAIIQACSFKATLKLVNLICGLFVSIDNLESKYTLEQAKSKVRILWIDDDYNKSAKGRENSITRYADSISRDRDHYNITTKSDAELTEASEYNIIICDYQGISGKDSHFLNGAEFITSLHERAPGAYVIACSGVTSFKLMTVPCDAFYSKGSFENLEVFKKMISTHIEIFFNPKLYWKKMLIKLTKLELWSYKLEKKLMKAYCQDYKSGTPTNLQKIKTKFKGHKDSKDLETIIDCFIKYISL